MQKLMYLALSPFEGSTNHLCSKFMFGEYPNYLLPLVKFKKNSIYES